MERAVDNNRRTLLVLTPAWVKSEWTEFEALLTQTTDPAGRRRRLWSQLKHEFHEETNGTNWVQNDRATFVKFAYSCHLYRNRGARDSKPLHLTKRARQ